MLNILTLGDPILKKTSALVPDIDANLVSLAAEMFQSMEQARGLGLAAVQVGRLVRLFITSVPRDKPRVFINPDILETSIEQVPCAFVVHCALATQFCAIKTSSGNLCLTQVSLMSNALTSAPTTGCCPVAGLLRAGGRPFRSR